MVKKKKRRVQSTSKKRELDLNAAASWPVWECLVRKNWRDTFVLAEILVSKTPPFGGVVSCMFLVDLACLGPKQGFVTQFPTQEKYEREFRTLMTDSIPMTGVNFPLAAKILRESISYAQELGFELPRGVQQGLSALGKLDAADECEEEIPLGGHDGLPHFMAGPDDDVDQILRTLEASCGRGNYNFTEMQGPIPPDIFD
jgi:hypothetical protein